MRLPVCQSLFGEHFCKNGPVVGNIVRAVTVRRWKSIDEGSTHHHIGHGVHGDVEALEKGGRLALIMNKHMNALVLCKREKFVNTVGIETWKKKTNRFHSNQNISIAIFNLLTSH
jgi:hypothetical protein